MLVRKILKVASATMLWALPLLGVSSAMAQTVPTFSAEALGANTGTAARPTYAVSSSASGGLELGDFHTDARLAAFYVRVTAGGVLRFAAAPPTVEMVTGPAPGTRTAGTASTNVAPTDPYRVFSIDGTSTLSGATLPVATSRVNVAVTDVAVTGIGMGTLTISIHKTEADALRNDDTQRSATVPVLAVARSVSIMARPLANPRASVVSDFRHFIGQDPSAPYFVNLGGFHVDVEGGHFDPTTGGMLSTLDGNNNGTPGEGADLYMAVGIDTSDSGTTFRGTGGFGWGSAFHLNQNAQCSGLGPDGRTRAGGINPLPEADRDTKAGPLTGGVAPGAWYLCVRVDPTNAVEIQESNYYVDVTLGVGTAGRSFEPLSADNILIGMIGRDGTTVDIPFLTTYDGYVQRLAITNRNKQDVRYTLTFVAEGAGVVSPGSITGMAAGESRTVVKIGDQATFVGPTRAAGVLTVVSSDVMVDVSTELVDKSTGRISDSVVLHRGRHP